VTVETRINRRLFATWLALVAITMAYLWIDHVADNGAVRTASVAVTITAIVVALVKVRIIMREFMEVRHSPPLLCRITDLWILLMAVAMLGAYFVGRTVA
jgi:hypothetical protein